MDTPSAFPKFESRPSLESYLVENALKNYAALFGQPNFYWGPIVYNATTALPPSPLPSPPPSPPPATPDSTNTQVKGVDEADLIETDGQYLYQVNGRTLTIVDVQDRSDLKIASQLTIPAPWELDQEPDAASITPTPTPISTNLPTFPVGGPTGGWNNIDGVYLQGDRLTVISTGWAPQPLANSTSSWIYPGYNPGQAQVQVTVLDVADPSCVSILEVSVLEGSLITSRAIGDEVFVITSNGFQLPAPLVIPKSGEPNPVPPPTVLPIGPQPLAPAAIDLIAPWPPNPTGTYETKEAYLDRIKNQVLDLALPNVVTRNAYGETVESGLLAPATKIYKPLNDNPYSQLFNVSTFNTGDNHLGVDQVSGIPTDWGNNVFVSAENIYLLQSTYESSGYKTKILQIDLDTNELLATGEVPGLIDNRFSADEYEGFLRISTTTGFGDASRNNVYVLDQVAQRLEIVGKLEGLAPGERIFSTRFQGNYGFVVTFRQVDPLFTIDLSDPKNPKLAGELKIPGFSEYLQVIQQGDRTLLLGVGRDADATGRARELKVSLFDVTDPKQPIEIDSYIFTGFGTSSDALWDNKAITYVPDQKLLAIPTQQIRTDGSFGTDARLTVFNIDAKQGIDRIGEISHDSDWINRSVSIRNDLYAVSQKRVSVYGVPGLETIDDIRWDGPAPYLEWSSLASGNVATFTASDASPIPNRIYGNGTQDRLIGSLGDDEIYGADTTEWFDSGAGSDTLYLNGGEDIVVLSQDGGSDIIHGFEVGKSKFGLANGLMFGDLTIGQAEGFASVRLGDRLLARVNWVDATRLNQSSNFMGV